MGRVVFKISVGFVTGALVLLAVSLYLSNIYLKEHLRLVEAGNPKGAGERIDQAARLDPFSPEPSASEGHLAVRQGRTKEATEAFQQAIQRDPHNYRNYAALGNLQRQQLGDPQAAVKSYGDALRYNPHATPVVSRLAEALLITNDLEGARARYEWLQSRGRIPLKDLYNLGKIQIRLAEPEEAIKTFEEAKERANTEQESLDESQRDAFLESLDLGIADALVVQGSYDAAREVLLQSSAEQAPARLALLDDPDSYRESVLETPIS